MPAGLQVFNDSHTIQIDQDYISFALRTSGQLWMGADNMTHPQPMVVGSVSVTTTVPIIAFRAEGKEVNLERVTGNGPNVYTFHFRCQSYEGFWLQYWVFEQGAFVNSGSNGGLQVFRADGLLAFDSASKPLRIVGVSSPPLPYIPPNFRPPGPGQYYSTTETYLPPGRVYAAVQGASAYLPTMWDAGGYGPNPEIPLEPTDPGMDPGIPPDAQWKTMHLESYYASAKFEGNLFTAGLTRFEYFYGPYPIQTAEHAKTYGSLMHWLVDVTGY